MKTILITGGANGIGKGLAIYYLKKGDRVIVIGSSTVNGNTFYNETKQLGVEERAVYIQADLSLVKENQRIIEEIKGRFPALDILVFCAAKHNKEYIETTEGVEFTFALAYLSRFVLSYGLKECLEKTDNPIILNVCGSGMNGNVNWNDLQHKNSFDAQKVMMHGSRLNDLLGVEFIKNDTAGKIKYILYNPWAVKTPGMMEYGNLLMKLVYKIMGKPIEKAIIPITELLNNTPPFALSAYREYKNLDLSLATYSKENAVKLYNLTIQFLDQLE